MRFALSQPPAGPEPLGDFVAAIGRWLHRLLAMPPQASEAAPGIDRLQYAQFLFFAALGAVVIGFAAWFLLRYRRSRRPLVATPRIVSPAWLELGVAAFLLVSFVLFWVVGFRQFVAGTVAPDDSLEVFVTARQWVWKFTYPDGRASAGVLYVPRDRPVRLILTSRDVIHSFFVPAFRSKRDVVPGRFTSTWFTATREGTYPILCAELCGAGHSRMWGDVVVLPEDQFERWLAGREPRRGIAAGRPPVTRPGEPERRQPVGLAERGLEVAAVAGCLRCHTTDGSPHLGPTWLGLYGREVALAGGGTAIADEAYLTESMMDPMAEIVAGFDPIMPTYQGVLGAGETAAIVSLIRSLEAPEDVPPSALAPRPAEIEPPPPAGGIPAVPGPEGEP